MIVSELKEALRARGALTNGSKAVLVERLLAAEEAQVVDAEGAEEEDAEEDTDEVLMRQCTCNGAYESDEVVRCIQCKELFHILCEGLGIDGESKKSNLFNYSSLRHEYNYTRVIYIRADFTTFYPYELRTFCENILVL
jgi:hypothetical protein